MISKCQEEFQADIEGKYDSEEETEQEVTKNCREKLEEETVENKTEYKEKKDFAEVLDGANNKNMTKDQKVPNNVKSHENTPEYCQN